MDEARRVLERLERIERLERDSAPSGTLLDELRALIVEAEEWVRVEPDPERLLPTVERCRSAMTARTGEEGMLLAP
jgi:hypothetical protein